MPEPTMTVTQTQTKTVTNTQLLVATAALAAAAGLAFMGAGLNKKTTLQALDTSDSGGGKKTTEQAVQYLGTNTCTDTDNGFNIQVKGTVKVVNELYGQPVVNETDDCADTGVLTEWFCTASSTTGAASAQVDCAACKNGACDKLRYTCETLEVPGGGQSIGVKITDHRTGQVKNMPYSCNGNTLVQYYCNSNYKGGTNDSLYLTLTNIDCTRYGQVCGDAGGYSWCINK